MAFYGVVPFGITFTDTSSVPGATAWNWDFGDSVGTSTLQNPSYTYTTAGTYTVTLQVTSSYGLTTVTDTVVAYDLADVLGTDMVAAWEMDDAIAGGVRADYFGNHDLADQISSGTIALGVGVIGDCTDYSGTTAFSNNGTLNIPSEFSISGFFYTRATTDQYVWSYDENTVSGTISIHFHPASFDGLRFFTDIATPATTTTAISLDAWHYFLAWRSAGTNYIQVDNGLVASAVGPDPIWAPGTQLRVGRHCGGGGQLDGMLDELRLWETPIVEQTARDLLFNSGNGLPLPLSGGPSGLGIYPGAGLLSSQTDAASYVENDPQVVLRISNDAGKTWITQPARSAGKMGEYGKRVIWRRLGAARRRVFEAVVTDPIPWRLTGAYLRVTDGSGQAR